jgi:hypothetical protein
VKLYEEKKENETLYEKYFLLVRKWKNVAMVP